jgi:Cellulase M and related proteins
MKKFKKELFELLTIQAPSGKEVKVVNYLRPKLEKLCDKVFTDDYGNLLAEKVVGDGNGATVILSAHMDTVSNIQKGRKVLWDERTQTFRSSKGVLGADDRAGIAIILAVLRNIDKTEFNGKLLISFSREEEIGCVGADKIDENWYKDANLAIVVDRRGNRDIVTGCGSPWNFCSKAVGEFFEDVSAILDMDWKAVGGGVSDAMVFSSNGVHSVNLSAGYSNEHTEKETVHVPSCRDTINLILQALSLVNTQYHKFGEVPKSYNRYYYGYGYSGYYDDYYYDLQEEYDSKGEVTFYDGYDTFGNVVGSTVAGFVSIYQAEDGANTTGQEVFIDESNFRKLIDQYCLVTGYKVGSQLKKEKEQQQMDDALNAIINEEPIEYNGKHYTTNANGELVPMADCF